MPLPDAPTVSVRGWDWDCWVNVAMTIAADVSVTLQEPVPAHAPLQPMNVEPVGATVAGVAVKVTTVPLPKVPEQVVPQRIPDGALITTPLPVPIITTARLIASAVVPHAVLE